MAMKHEIVDGGKVLAIAIDITPEAIAKAVSSASGKTKVIASTHGFTGIGLPNGKVMQLSLNLTTK